MALMKPTLIVGMDPGEHVVRGRPMESSWRGTRRALAARATRRPRSVTLRSMGRVSPADQDGFTLVELLVVVFVLVALVGIAVPTFVNQREGAWDAAVRSELRAATIALASHRAQNGIYDVRALTDGGWGYESSADVKLRYDIDDTNFCLIAWFQANSPDPSPSEGFSAIPTSVERLWSATQGGSEQLVTDPSAGCGS